MQVLKAGQIKHYVKDRLLLDITELEVQQHERIGLVGPNGSGKTTLLQILAQKITPDNGFVHQYVECEYIPQLKIDVSTKSGGEVTQEYIQKSLNRNSGLLLLDEPTTHLDLSHINWLEKSMKSWQGAFILVSHDRIFLDALCTSIWEIKDGQLTKYKGNYSEYVKQKEVEKNQEQAAYEKYVKEKKQLEEALILKEEKAKRATKKPKKLSSSEARITGTKPYFAKKQKKLYQSAKAIETRIENLEKVEKSKERAPIKMDLPHADLVNGRIVFRFENVEGSFGERKLWKKASFFIRGGDKLAIIGANGTGKTTLLKKIMARDVGISISPSIQMGYFSQKLDILDTEKTILENVQSTSKRGEDLIRTVLARLHFYHDDVYKPVGVLSGGERVKVAFAKLFVSDLNTLVLDEPTNFLDTEAVEALESLLQDYEGTIIFVSHDRQFIEKIATRILEIKKQKIHIFEGSYTQYVQQQKPKKDNSKSDQLLLLETKITEVLSRLSIEPSSELEMEFQRLLKEKRELK